MDERMETCKPKLPMLKQVDKKCYAIRIKSVIIIKLSVILFCGNFFNIVNPLCLYVCIYTNKYYYSPLSLSQIPTDQQNYFISSLR